MKKISILVAALFASAMLFLGTGCSGDDDDTLLGPTKTWCTMPLQYKNSESGNSTELYISFFYTDTDIPADSSTNGYKTAIPAGLTIMITSQSDSASVISGLTNTAYILKTFPKDKASTTEDGYSFIGSRAKWTLIYLAKSELRKSANQSKTVPAQLNYSQRNVYTELSWENIKDQFSWKRLLANYLLG